jgi:hypothetical protein
MFEMRGGGLQAVENAAAIFLPSTEAARQAAADDDDDDQEDLDGTDNSSSSSSSRKNELVGTGVGVVVVGNRPLPIEVQALAISRLQEGPPAAAGAVGDQEDMAGWEDTGTDLENHDVTGRSRLDDGSESSSTFADASDDNDEEQEGDDDNDAVSNDDNDDAYVLRRGRGGWKQRLAAAASSSGSSSSGREPLAPAFHYYVGITDRNRMIMLLNLLSKYTPIKVISRVQCSEQGSV